MDNTQKRELTGVVVTLWYRAPELLLESKTYGYPVDMWSAGCVFGELFLGTPLLPGKVEMEQVRLIIELLGTPTARTWPDFIRLPFSEKVIEKIPVQPHNRLCERMKTLGPVGLDFLGSLLAYDPQKRLTVKEALSHPYFREQPHPKDLSMMPTFPCN